MDWVINLSKCTIVINLHSFLRNQRVRKLLFLSVFNIDFPFLFHVQQVILKHMSVHCCVNAAGNAKTKI